MPAPIILFVYKRPKHTQKTIEALLQNNLAEKSDLYIFSDGPKNPRDASEVNQVREIINNIKGFRGVHITEHPNNFGLADSIYQGVSQILETHESCIVLEDDIITTPEFLTYMNKALEIYKDSDRVMQISGYSYPIKKDLPETFFIDRITSWGWATWKRAWDGFEYNTENILEDFRNKPEYIRKLNMNDNFNFYSSLIANKEGLVKTWAVRWQACVTLNDGLCLFPNESYIENIGLDNTGENSSLDKSLYSKALNHNSNIKKIEPIKINQKAQQKIANFYKKIKPNLFQKIKNKIKLWLK